MNIFCVSEDVPTFSHMRGSRNCSGNDFVLKFQRISFNYRHNFIFSEKSQEADLRDDLLETNEVWRYFQDT